MRLQPHDSGTYRRPTGGWVPHPRPTYHPLPHMPYRPAEDPEAWGPTVGHQELEPTLAFFLRRRWIRAASCTVLSVSAWWAGASETWAIMVVRQLVAARDSCSSIVSLWSLGAEGRL